MHSAWLAEWLLCLTTTKERAASIIGDLNEEVPTRGRLWFWFSITHTFLSIVRRSLEGAPFSMAVYAVFAWFWYMFVSLALWVCAAILMNAGWGITYWLSHHTGLELLWDVLRVRIPWGPVPPSILRGTEYLVICMAAPFQVGRVTARSWRDREVAAWLIMSLLWPFLAAHIPFAAMYVRVSPPLVALMLAFLLTGIVFERSAQLRLGGT
jgi:hypothetical protein